MIDFGGNEGTPPCSNGSRIAPSHDQDPELLGLNEDTAYGGTAGFPPQKLLKW